MSSMGPRAFVLWVVVAAVGACASPAWASFAGRDGDLVVASDAGLELVAPSTAAVRPICSSAVLCGHPSQPSFSPNGRAIAFVDMTTHRPVVVAADGSCLWCLQGARLTSLTGSEPAFTPDSQAVTVAGNGLWSIGLIGRRSRRLLTGPVDRAVWSSRGLAALVRRGWIWVGPLGHGKLRRLQRGGSPSFSPDGTRVAVARDGYVWLVRVADGSERRLVQGGSPAWSPDGRQIAYIAAGGAVEIVAVQGGRPYHVGSVHGSALDWQPLPTSPRHACTPPKASTVVASNRDAIVFLQRGSYAHTRFYGCLKALGRTRLLLDGWPYFYALTSVRLAGRFAALETEGESQYAFMEGASVYDLGSGHATPLASVGWDWNGGPTVYELDSLAIDSSGFAVWRETTRPWWGSINALSCPAVSLCVGAGEEGNILSSTNPTGGAQAWSLDEVVEGGPLLAASCPSISLCVASGWNHLLTATDPAGGSSAWTSTPTPTSTGVYAISCPSVSLCVGGGSEAGVHGGAAILTSTDPTGGAGSWSSTVVGSRDEIVNEVSCPSVSLCVATANTHDVFTSTNPAGGPSAWNRTRVDQRAFLSRVSCPSVSLCVASDSSGNIVTTTNPTGGASAWTEAMVDPASRDRPGGLDGLSCPSVSLCVAGDASGNILTSTDPLGGASAWTIARVARPSPIDNSVTAVSCPSVSLCVAGDDSGNILTSTDPTGGASTWTIAPVDIPGCAPQSRPCASEQLYAHDDQGTRVVDTAPPGQGTWIGNVAVASLVLSWTRDGAQRQLQLR